MSSFDSDSGIAASSSRPSASPPPRRRTQAERSDKTQQRVLTAAVKVLRRKGYAGLRTDEVARVAGVSRGAMQYHFRTKDSLVRATAQHLMKDVLSRGSSRAQAARISGADAIDGLIEDCIDFFLGPDFNTILDLVLAGSKDRGLKTDIYAFTRDSRLGVEQAWLEVLCEQGIASDKAENLMWITISIVRGFAVRALWERDDERFASVLDEWKLILREHLKKQT